MDFDTLPLGVWIVIMMSAAGVFCFTILLAVSRRRALGEAQADLAARRDAEQVAEQRQRGKNRSPWTWYLQGQLKPRQTTVPPQPSPPDSQKDAESPLSVHTAEGARVSPDQSPLSRPRFAPPSALSASLSSIKGDFTRRPTGEGSPQWMRSPQQGGISFWEGELVCQHEDYHDFGPGLPKRCYVCGRKPILNRGCEKCQQRLCEACFMWHRLVPPSVRPAPVGSPASPRCGMDGTHASIPPPRLVDINEFSLPDDLALDVVHTRPSKHRATKEYQHVRTAAEAAGGCAATPADAQYFTENIDHLRKGGALHYFTFLKGTSAKGVDLDLSARLFQLTAFEDEHAPPPVGNAVPHVDPKDPQQRSKYTFVVNRATYIIPPSQNWSFDDITPQLVASHYYQRCAQPANTDVLLVKDERDQGLQWHPNTFRIRKPIIPGIYKFTCQFRCTEIPERECRELASQLCEGLRIDRGILLERTKRNPSKGDMIAKAKSVLLYHKLGSGGVVCTNITTGVATSIPWIISAMVDKLSFLSAGDVTDTVNTTRHFFAEKMFKDCAVYPPPGFAPNDQQSLD